MLCKIRMGKCYCCDSLTLIDGIHRTNSLQRLATKMLALSCFFENREMSGKLRIAHANASHILHAKLPALCFFVSKIIFENDCLFEVLFVREGSVIYDW